MRILREQSDAARVLGLLYGLVGLALVAALLILPETFFPACGLRNITGLPCPACGGTRAALALSGGDIPGALRSNALITLAALAWMAWATVSLIATLWPRLRWQPRLGPREKQTLRWATVAAVIAQWSLLLTGV